VLDYGIKMKLNDGTRMITHGFHMINLLMMLKRGKSDTYIQSIIMSYLVLMHQRKFKLPPWTMFTTNFSAFNEEAGELGFSMLARSVLGDSQKNKFEHLSKMYILTHTHGDIENDQWSDAKARKKKSGWRKKISEGDPACDATAVFMSSQLREIKKGGYKVLDKADLEFQTNHNKGVPAQVQYKAHLKPLWVADTSEFLQVQVARCSRFFTDWGHDVRHIWPELVCKALLTAEEKQVDLRDSSAEDDDEDTTTKDPAFNVEEASNGSDSDIAPPPPPAASDDDGGMDIKHGDSDGDAEDRVTPIPAGGALVPAGRFRWDSDIDPQNISGIHRSSRSNKGKRNNDDQFPMVRSYHKQLKE
jgi:hypothetical protein